MQSQLRMDQANLSRLFQMAIAGYPFETCGLLLGIRTAQSATVAQVCQARNLNADRPYDRYEIDPEDMLAAETAARRQDLAVIGVWHTHPDHSAEPSETDRTAAWETWSYLILAVDCNGVTEFRSWRLNSNRQFVEETIKS